MEISENPALTEADTLMPELDTLLELFDYKPGTYTLENGIKYRAWYEGEEFKVEEVAD